MKVALIVVVVVLAAVGVMAALGTWLGNASFMRRAAVATPVRLDTVVRGELVELVSAPGEVEPRTKVSISARIVARIEKLPYKEGQTVTKGGRKDADGKETEPSLLVKLDAKDLEAELRSAKARYEGQKAEITVAERRIESQAAQIEATRSKLREAGQDLRRQKQLLDTDDVSESTVETAQAKVDQFKAQINSEQAGLKADRANIVVMRHNLDAADAQIARAQDNLSYTVITSPIDGVVTRLNAEEGELVVTGTMNNAGTVIMEVADLSQMLLVARVDETTVAGVEVGQSAKVNIHAYPDEVFQGTVESVALAHTADQRDASKYYETKILLKTGGRRIYSGLTADVEIQTRKHKDVLKVPGQAVLGRAVDDLPAHVRAKPEVDQGKTFTTVVYRMVNGEAVATPVKIGPSDVTHTIIKSGLSPGDAVIVGPYKVLETLKHGQKVKDEKAATTQPTKAAR